MATLTIACNDFFVSHETFRRPRRISRKTKRARRMDAILRKTLLAILAAAGVLTAGADLASAQAIVPSHAATVPSIAAKPYGVRHISHRRRGPARPKRKPGQLSDDPTEASDTHAAPPSPPAALPDIFDSRGALPFRVLSSCLRSLVDRHVQLQI
jgi:hypothetical protein